MTNPFRPLALLVSAVIGSVPVLPAQDATNEVLDPALARRIERLQNGFDPANRLSGVLLVAQGDSVPVSSRLRLQ